MPQYPVIILVLLIYILVTKEWFENNLRVHLLILTLLLIYHLLTNSDQGLWTTLLGYSGAEILLTVLTKRRQRREEVRETGQGCDLS